MEELTALRRDIDAINHQLLKLLNRRAELTLEIQKVKTRDGIPTYLPEQIAGSARSYLDQEKARLDELIAANEGPFCDDTIRRLFREVSKASVALMEQDKQRVLQVSRETQTRDRVITVNGLSIGGAQPVVIAGPCAVEDEHQMERVARSLVENGVRLMRGGAFKPRTSPYSFQGLREKGLALLSDAARRHDLISVSEVMDTRSVALCAEHVDILQVGARNMYNYELLRELGKCSRPVLLKRGLSATLEELLLSAEYIVAAGNPNVIFCERGIRTYERETRNTLDISAVPLLRQKSHLPVIVDVTHAAGRKDILLPLSKAALAAGANGIMVEAHPAPHLARSDSEQQLDLDELALFLAALSPALRGQKNDTTAHNAA
jgi:3-deoxy-7-phosphoheptulonate synthase/chorismate mutase